MCELPRPNKDLREGYACVDRSSNAVAVAALDADAKKSAENAAHVADDSPHIKSHLEQKSPVGHFHDDDRDDQPVVRKEKQSFADV